MNGDILLSFSGSHVDPPRKLIRGAYGIDSIRVLIESLKGNPKSMTDLNGNEKVHLPTYIYHKHQSFILVKIPFLAWIYDGKYKVWRVNFSSESFHVFLLIGFGLVEDGLGQNSNFLGLGTDVCGGWDGLNHGWKSNLCHFFVCKDLPFSMGVKENKKHQVKTQIFF